MPQSQQRKTASPHRRIGAVVPAHNESLLIDACIRSLQQAAAFIRASDVIVDIHVVCDACSDDTAARVAARGLQPLEVEFRNVGRARAAGAEAALSAGASWLAFTDADTRVSPTWFVDQLGLGADAFCGTIAVDDWDRYGLRMEEHFARTYFDIDGHRHIHGANFGISAAAYRATGGFQPLASSEDVALVDALLAHGLRIAWSALPRVTTSARPDFRAPEGFGATLERVAASFHELTAPALPLAI